MTTNTEFNAQYKDYIEDRYYGLTIDDPQVVGFLDDYFKVCIREKIDFKIQQIKSKFGYAKVYTTLPDALNTLLEKQINILTGKVKFTPTIIG